MAAIATTARSESRPQRPSAGVVLGCGSGLGDGETVGFGAGLEQVAAEGEPVDYGHRDSRLLLHHAHVVVTSGDSHRLLSEATNGNGVAALS